MCMKKITREEQAALEILKSTGISVIEAAMVASEALQRAQRSIRRVRYYLQLGEENAKLLSKTVSFERAVEEALAAREDRRARTRMDFRYICRRLMKRNPELARRKVRSITPEDCRRCLQAAFDTPQQFRKARAILSGVFTTSVRRGWCSCNPVRQVECPRVVEEELPVLSPAEIEHLMQKTAEYEGGRCLAAVGLMLYAGVRPHEVARLSWQAVDLQHGCISISPQHSKTGGARRITIQPPLLRLLQRCVPADLQVSICPPNWLKHWRHLHRFAGWESGGKPWPSDVLRHTFASYHLAHFRNYSELQMEIGHRDSNLLRTRYLNLSGVGNTSWFWETGVLPLQEGMG